MADAAAATAVRPASATALDEIRAGLSAPQKWLPPKYFYDERGSHLFEEITRLPEYYLTRTERALLDRWMPAWVGALAPATLVELGAGSAEKTRVVLDAMGARAAGDGPVYVPVDVSEAFLRDTADRIRADYPRLRVVPAVADISERFTLPAHLPHPVLHALLGSTIGNFAPGEAVALLRRVVATMGREDRFLLGVDLRKPPAVIEAAYNDSAGVTAEFNRNMLRVLNAETGADFDPDAFRHRAFYDADEHRIEMHLVSPAAQEVEVPGIGTVRFAPGESVRTEISCKHDRGSVDALFTAAGLRVERWAEDGDALYAITLAAPA
jgi:L-histidine Nalpha-methyltransferase